MYSRYIQYHIENLKSSALVNLPIGVVWANISNPCGQYWASIGSYVLGLHDVRPRQGTFTNPWGATSNPLFAAPKLKFNNNTLATLLDRRANELLSLDQRIAIMWSGGIDSTCVLAALIKNSTNLSQLVIYCSNKSIQENPEFYNKLIKNKIECREVDELDVTNEFIDEHVLLHGDPGDCVFGPSMPMYRHLLANNQQRLPWRQNQNLIVQGIVNTGGTVDFSRWYTNKVSANIDEVGVAGIDSISDWWWWHYYNLKWEFSLLRPFLDTRSTAGRPCISDDTLKKYSNTVFYNTEYFQCWSYSNLHKLCHNPAQHKMDAKQYIFDLDHNQEYLNNKRKVESLVRDPKQRPAYLDKNLRAHYPHDPGLKEAIIECLENFKG